MSIVTNGYLGNGGVGIFFRDWQHAARLYVDDTYRLAPKPKFLFYAVFNIADEALSTEAFREQNRRELNYLVKKMDLPRYTLNTENLNQYNRKTMTYTKIQYDPVNITFHDDNNGVTNALWALYYGYYFADRNNSPAPYTEIDPVAYKYHTYDPKSQFPYNYGLDNNTPNSPFFNSIQLITLSKHKFTSYLLCNPKILTWQHDTMDQSEGNGVVENTMSVGYDAVIYSTGTIAVDNPSGFAVLHYDQAQSPLGPDNQRVLQGTSPSEINNQGLYADNSFNPIDSGITLLGALTATSTIGNRLPYGYGSEAFALPTYSPFTTSGIQNYNFTSAPTLRSSLDRGNINPVQFAPIDREFTTGAEVREQAINDQFASALNSTTTGAPIISDVYTNNLPRSTPGAVESKIFNNIETGKEIPEALGPVNIDYFIESDITSNSYPVNELINNNPTLTDLPEDPFE